MWISPNPTRKNVNLDEGLWRCDFLQRIAEKHEICERIAKILQISSKDLKKTQIRLAFKRFVKMRVSSKIHGEEAKTEISSKIALKNVRFIIELREKCEFRQSIEKKPA